ncbi:MAG: DUF4402 domain-containing protein [Rubrivivax sp.]|nr:MAG: DUF4402 domain-containing protein [Rubrivivax sp.]
MRAFTRSSHVRSLSALGVLLLLGTAGMRTVQAADNASASATAVVLQPIAVSKNADLVFGNVVIGNGDVTVATDGTRTRSGTTALPTGVTPVAARFDVTGSGNNTFAVSYVGSDTVLTDLSANTMAVDWIVEVVGTATPTGKTDATTDPTTGTLNAGAAFIFVGGKLTVGVAQPAGTYTGSVVVTVAYN